MSISTAFAEQSAFDLYTGIKLDRHKERLDQLEAIATSQGQRLQAINDLVGKELERAKRVER